MLIDDGLLVREDGRWAATRDLAAVPVPPTIQRLLAARLDRLDADERAVIERAAVEGKVFHEGAVAELAPEALRPSVGDAPRRARAQGADPARQAGAHGRARLPLPPSPDPRCRLRLDSEGSAGGAARAVRALARGTNSRADARLRGDHRLPPRAGLPVPGRARTGRRRDPAARTGGGRAARARRPQGVHPRRRRRGREPDLPGRRAAAGGRSRRVSTSSRTSGSFRG